MSILGLLAGLVMASLGNVPLAIMPEGAPQPGGRGDGAIELNIRLSGSLQNPAFSPDGHQLVFTRFRDGYNRGAADLFIFDFDNGRTRELVSDGSVNVNLPGASWNSTRKEIVFSSDRGDHDELFVIADVGKPGDERQLTRRRFRQAFEPSYSPYGRWVVFEDHGIDQENGSIAKYWYDGGRQILPLTSPDEIIKQPNWSPLGDKILYQKLEQGLWRIWYMAVDGSNQVPITPTDWSSTDAVFAANGQKIIFSAEHGTLDTANIFSMPVNGGDIVPLTHYSGYDGAPSISGNGQWVVFESRKNSPDQGGNTRLWIRELTDRL